MCRNVFRQCVTFQYDAIVHLLHAMRRSTKVVKVMMVPVYECLYICISNCHLIESYILSYILRGHNC